MKALFIGLAVATLLAGCGKKPAPVSPVAGKPDAVSIQGGGTAEQPPPPPGAPATEAEPTAAAALPADVEKALRDLTDAVRAHYMTQGKPPTSLDDLVKAGLIAKLPKPPPGKQYVMDERKTSARLVDK